MHLGVYKFVSCSLLVAHYIVISFHIGGQLTKTNSSRYLHNIRKWVEALEGGGREGEGTRDWSVNRHTYTYLELTHTHTAITVAMSSEVISFPADRCPESSALWWTWPAEPPSRCRRCCCPPESRHACAYVPKVT